MVRLNKYIANTGFCSRREADALISSGKVKINGDVIVELGTKIDPTTAPEIMIRNQLLPTQPTHFTYVMLNKPKGYVVTKAEFDSEQSVMQLLPKSLQTLNPVGRLDKNSDGIVLFTNDGDLMLKLTHPRYQHDKEYIVRVKYPLTSPDLQAWGNGVELEEGNTGKNPVTQIDDYRFKITLRQGWNRQVRRMVEARRNKVQSLQRTRFGKLTLGQLALGKWQIVQKADIC